ncbi:MAG: flavodoxin [Clostridia bacterium]|nr:flavodoxin [Clostridia bacterium]
MSTKCVVYFSASGVTAEKALLLAKVAPGNAYEIKPVKPYTDADVNWRNPLSRCNREKIKNSKPEIETPELELNRCEVLFLGFPIWYYCEPLVVDGFLDAYAKELTDTKVVLFATSGGSSFGKTVEKMKAKYPSINFIEGTVMNGNYTEEEMKNFADKY